MVVLTFLQVSLRALYTHAHLPWANSLMGDLDWSEPFVRLLVLWLAFLGASLLTKDNKHIRIDLFSSLLPHKYLPARDFILSLVCALICGIMFKVCLEYVGLEKEFGGSLFLCVPNWTAQIILPIGFFMLFFRFCLRALDQSMRTFGSRK
jgi:TRAP-type C4-dicarboxylate transport system permease small subunit